MRQFGNFTPIKPFTNISMVIPVKNGIKLPSEPASNSWKLFYYLILLNISIILLLLNI